MKRASLPFGHDVSKVARDLDDGRAGGTLEHGRERHGVQYVIRCFLSCEKE
jgi:hypothetical protein